MWGDVWALFALAVLALVIGGFSKGVKDEAQGAPVTNNNAKQKSPSDLELL
jgi:hypothetical protein